MKVGEKHIAPSTVNLFAGEVETQCSKLLRHVDLGEERVAPD